MTGPVLEEVEVFDRAVSAWVIRTPGRQYPGVVVQGDTLSSWSSLADHIRNELAQNPSIDPELVEEAAELAELLSGHLVHYERVLKAHGLDLPYVRPRT